MGFFSRKPPEPPPPKTRIAPGTSLAGDLESKDTIVFEGSLEGSITCKAALLFGAGGRIRGVVRTDSLDCEGSGEGSVFTDGTARFGPSSSWQGEFSPGALKVEKGARLVGTFKPRKK